MKETFVWSAIGGMHLRAVGSRIGQATESRFMTKGDANVCLYIDEGDHVIGACTINADPLCARLATLLDKSKVCSKTKSGCAICDHCPTFLT